MSGTNTKNEESYAEWWPMSGTNTKNEESYAEWWPMSGTNTKNEESYAEWWPMSGTNTKNEDIFPITVQCRILWPSQGPMPRLKNHNWWANCI